MTEHTFEGVARVQDESGSHIEPPLEQDWPESRKLAWHAAVATLDSGMPIRVHQYPENWCVTAPGMSMGASNYHEAWELITGLESGARAYRYHLETEPS